MVLIVDGNNLLHRLFWVLNSQGVATKESLTNSVVRSVKALERDFLASRVIIAWDKKLLWPSTNFRKEEMQGDYKSSRGDTSEVYEWESDIINYIETSESKWKQMYPRCLEADDVIAFYVERGLEEGEEAIIVSNDKDLLQLISGNVSVWHPKKKKLYTEKAFVEEYKFAPGLFWKYKALVGDSSDNIKGVKGIGPKKATKLITEGLESLSEEQLQLVLFNKRMIKLRGAYKLQEGEEEALLAQLN